MRLDFGDAGRVGISGRTWRTCRRTTAPTVVVDTPVVVPPEASTLCRQTLGLPLDEWQVAFVDDPGKRKAVLGAGCADEHDGGGGEAAQCAAGREMQMDAAESGDPCSAPTIRGFTADVLVIDEAAYIPHVGYAASRPMPAATQGDLVVMSSAHEPVGFFWDLMTRERPGASSGWVRKVVRARDMPRFSAAFLAEERRELGHEVYSREYDCEFGDVGSGIFQRPIVEEALSEDVKPLFKPKG